MKNSPDIYKCYYCNTDLSNDKSKLIENVFGLKPCKVQYVCNNENCNSRRSMKKIAVK